MTKTPPTPALPRGLVHPPFTDKVYVARSAAGIRLLLRCDDGSVVVRRSDEGGLRSWAAAQSEGLAAYIDERLGVTSPRHFAGLSLDRPLLMGVVNVTPDSFSDGGDFFADGAAIAHGRALAASGADIIDIGGESTRPGAEPLTPQQEIARILPVVQALAADGLTLSIDSRHAAVMRAALAAGARIINDVTALQGDPESLSVAAASGASVVLMHMQGQPQTMQQAPHYDHAPLDVYDALARTLARCRAAGLGDERLCVDPGIGFGKTVLHNCQLLSHLDLFHALGVPLLLGVSRKSFIAALSRGESVRQRLAGSLAAAIWGLQQDVQILRVHDIAETAQAVSVWRAIQATTMSEGWG